MHKATISWDSIKIIPFKLPLAALWVLAVAVLILVLKTRTWPNRIAPEQDRRVPSPRPTRPQHHPLIQLLLNPKRPNRQMNHPILKERMSIKNSLWKIKSYRHRLPIQFGIGNIRKFNENHRQCLRNNRKNNSNSHRNKLITKTTITLIISTPKLTSNIAPKT